MKQPKFKDGYLGNPKIKRGGAIVNYTAFELEEYEKCSNDVCYFARNYVMIISLDHGLVPFKLYDYQEKYLRHLCEHRFSVTLACRQSGKSITSVVYLLWYACFHADKTIVVLANKGATAREMLWRITLALENLPFFLQPGCNELNKGSIEFANNSKIVAASTTSSSVRGISANVIFLDEFAFIENDEKFYTSTYPVISSGKDTKVIITSTLNGIGNTFYRIWEAANQNRNEFKPFTINWWDVPGRDEAWKRQTIANTSEAQFRQEFENQALGRGNNLIDDNVLLSLKSVKEIATEADVMIHARPIEGHEYIMCVDVAQGRGQDYSTFTIVDITTRPFEVVAVYRNNNISPILLPSILHRNAKVYNDAFIIVENNDQGAVVCNGLYYDIEYENVYVDSTVKADAIGVRMDKKVKRIGCSNLKDLIEQRKLNSNNYYIITELSTFEAQGNSYAAAPGNHDDLVMNLVLFAWFVSTNLFNDMTDIDFKELLYNERLKAIEEDLAPVGIMTGYERPKYEIDGEGNIWSPATAMRHF
jgi:hypothetical protein